MSLLEELLEAKIISIIRGVSSDQIVPAVEALARGGVRFVEVTFRPSDQAACRDTLQSIALLKRTFSGRMHVGAGTVLTAAQVEEAAAVGAEFIISPNTNGDVIAKTKALGLLSLPGAYTPTEAEAAWEAGADIVKIFPADGLGPKYFKAVKASLSQLRLSAVGGVSEKNIGDFIAAGVDSFGIGSNLVSADKVARQAWVEIEEAAAFYVRAVKDCR